MKDEITVFKANWDDFLKWCETENRAFTNLEQFGEVVEDYLISQLRINTKYVN